MSGVVRLAPRSTFVPWCENLKIYLCMLAIVQCLHCTVSWKNVIICGGFSASLRPSSKILTNRWMIVTVANGSWGIRERLGKITTDHWECKSLRIRERFVGNSESRERFVKDLWKIVRVVKDSWKIRERLWEPWDIREGFVRDDQSGCEWCEGLCRAAGNFSVCCAMP